MATTTLEKPVYDLANGVRKIGESNILRKGIDELIDAIKADNFKMVNNTEGTRYVHVINDRSGEYFSVKVGKSVVSRLRGEALLKDLLENHVIYTGVTENGVWFTFGVAGATGEPEVEISLADLMKQKVAFYAGV